MIRSPDDEQAVSHVVGIVLLIALSLVLAGVAVVYFPQAAGDNPRPGPRFAADTEFNDSTQGEGQYLNVTHTDGEPLDTESVRFSVRDASVESTGNDARYEGDVIAGQAGDEFTAAETVSLNRTAFVDAGTGGALSGDALNLTGATVRIIWENEDGSQSAIVYECRVGNPDCRGG